MNRAKQAGGSYPRERRPGKEDRGTRRRAEDDLTSTIVPGATKAIKQDRGRTDEGATGRVRGGSGGQRGTRRGGRAHLGRGGAAGAAPPDRARRGRNSQRREP